MPKTKTTVEGILVPNNPGCGDDGAAMTGVSGDGDCISIKNDWGEENLFSEIKLYSGFKTAVVNIV